MGRAVRKTKPSGFLYDKMMARWDSIADFIRDTQCPVSSETTRKLVYNGEPVAAVSLIVIAHDLGCSPGEIKRMLVDEADRYVQSKSNEQEYARRLALLIGSGAGEGTTGSDRIILNALHALQENTDAYRGTGRFLALYAKALGKFALEKKLRQL